MSSTAFVPGYHLVPIRKGVLGELSKVQEELDELSDAWQQQDRILMSVELADLYGALQLFVGKYCISMRFEHLDSAPPLARYSGSHVLHDMQASLDQLRRDVHNKNPDVCARSVALFSRTIEQFVQDCVPGLTMDDVAIFSATTRRAFANGRR